MFVCTACRRQAYDTLITGLARTYLQQPAATRVLSRVRRGASSVAEGRRLATGAAGLSSHGLGAEQQDDAATWRESSPREDDLAPSTTSKSAQWAVKKELSYLKDPFHIADHVQRTLARDDFQKALLLTREASRNAKVTVSWNHLIKHEMARDKIRSAIKLYNEMKKRAQPPDARTYTLLFTGLAESVHTKLAVSEAVRLYHSLLSNDRLKPNTIHLNAVLEVCARAQDIDAMFGIAKTANHPLRAPNNRTYTIILNGLRPRTSRHQKQDLEKATVSAATKEAIQRAKGVWEEVIDRWRKAQIMVDEELACAMGRILLTGDYYDNRSVLELVEQTMGIPIPDSGGASPSQAPKQAAAGEDEVKPGMKVRQPREQTTTLARKSTGRLAAPGRNALSLILESLEKSGNTTLAHKYWDTLTETYGIIPDATNWRHLLAALRRGRASTKVAEYLQTAPRDILTAPLLRLGMSACLKDNLNQHAFANACKVFDLMTRQLPRPDPDCMRIFLQTAHANNRKFAAIAEKDPEAAKLAMGKQLLIALDRMWGPNAILQKSPSNPRKATTSPEDAWKAGYHDRLEVIGVSRKMVAAADMVVTERMAPDEQIQVVKSRRNILNRYVTSFYDKANEMQARLGGQTPRGDRDADRREA